MSTGGGDFTHPRGTAIKVDGGYRVSGRKQFASQSPVGAVMSTMFTFDDPERGRRVLNTAVPFGDGVTVHDTWDVMGMRGTASNDITIEDVFVPDEKILADRPHGVVDPPLQVIVSIAFPIISAVYLGVAEAAAAAAIDAVRDKADTPTIQRQVGLMQHRLRVAGWALDGAFAAVGDDPTPSMETVAAVMAAKREIALAGIEVCDLAMEAAGGGGLLQGIGDRAGVPGHPRRQAAPVHARGHAAPRRPPRPRPPLRRAVARPAHPMSRATECLGARGRPRGAPDRTDRHSMRSTWLRSSRGDR